MRKVTLNKYGDCVFTQKITDDTLSFGIKQHETCHGFVDIVQVSKTHQSFNCRKCNFRFVFPVEIETWSELKRFVRKRG